MSVGIGYDDMNLIADDFIRPCQQPRRYRHEFEAEIRLCAEVMRSAIDQHNRYCRKPPRSMSARGLWWQLEEWFASDDLYPYGFRYLCEILGIDDVAGFRRRLASGLVSGARLRDTFQRAGINLSRPRWQPGQRPKTRKIGQGG